MKELFQAIEDQVSALPIPADLREKFRLSHQGGQRNLFAMLTGAFASQFPGVTHQQLVTLSSSVYLSAHAVYLLDPVLDFQAEDGDILSLVRESHFLFNESTRLLTEIFSPEDAFWPHYYQRFDDHFAEPVLSKNVEAELDLSAYQALLAKKYSLLFVPLIGLHHLSNRQHTVQFEKLNTLMQRFIIGYNIPNEIKGVSDDIRGTINNYAFWRLKKLLPEYEMDAHDYSADELHKMVYATGLASQLYDEALHYLNQARQMAEEEKLPLLVKLLDDRIESTEAEKIKVNEEMNLINS
jgi:hypothetical protein